MKRKKRLLKGADSLERREMEHLEKADQYERDGKSIYADYARKEARIYREQKEKKRKKVFGY